MKKIKHCILFSVFLLIFSCAAVTRQNAVVERDEFLNKFPILNNEILGELKYNNPDLDLRELEIRGYPELFDKVDLSEDYKKIIYFIRNYAKEGKLVVRRDTFIICLRSVNYTFVICDDASTPSVDRIDIGEPIPVLDGFCANFLKSVHQKEKME